MSQTNSNDLVKQLQANQRNRINERVRKHASKYPKRSPLDMYYLKIGDESVPLVECIGMQFDEAVENESEEIEHNFFPLETFVFPMANGVKYPISMHTSIGDWETEANIFKNVTPKGMVNTHIVTKNYHQISITGIADRSNDFMIITNIKWTIPIRCLTDPGKKEFCGLVFITNSKDPEEIVSALRLSSDHFGINVIHIQSEYECKKVYVDFHVRTENKDNILNWLTNVDDAYEIEQITDTAEEEEE